MLLLTDFFFNRLTCFVGQQVGDASELLWDGARPHHGPRDLGVFLNHPAENHLPHVQVDTQAVSNKNRSLCVCEQCWVVNSEVLNHT